MSACFCGSLEPQSPQDHVGEEPEDTCTRSEFLHKEKPGANGQVLPFLKQQTLYQAIAKRAASLSEQTDTQIHSMIFLTFLGTYVGNYTSSLYEDKPCRLT